ncbi:MAG TPA: decaprenyl-phosphate phosphoribosyltransferase [Polyangia bacterium]|nr:decaprenyl-phosphate phosphoribosyltransferase [Polyangia bacterium]
MSQTASGKPARPFVGLALLKAMRPKQWIKNLLVFAGFVFTLNERWHPFSPTMWEFLRRSAAAFVLFSAVSSSIYLLNDVIDVERDRQHPTKRNRPIASGALSPSVALVAAFVLMIGGLVAAAFLSKAFAAVLGGYVVMQLGYVFVFKNVPLLDVFILALGFVLRAFAGTAVLGVAISPWLYTVTLLGSLFLALCKRRNELMLLESGAAHHRKILKEYTTSLLDSLISIVASSTIMAYSLYTFTSPTLPADHLMMATVPLVIFGLFRYLFLAHSKNSGGSPEEVFLTDRPLIVTVFLWIAITGIILTRR